MALHNLPIHVTRYGYMMGKMEAKTKENDDGQENISKGDLCS